ncbi:uncharacterized protein EAE98_010386 [Botrytis deweyae]|uniref:F-box domain-containing protein n=1 Tax=Botrytis deweyae TaxID=2478750 RepID=A0ABQ7I8M8_9HELO|nr:uncharacterized protein EAE98_010386 [Botrytis deweyae]KAF7916955.1 hypothetical protein EAE98_010386 [Botrytis deweyae]
MESSTIAFNIMSLSDAKVLKLSYLSTIPNEIFDTIMAEAEIQEPQNVTVRCKRSSNTFEIHSDMQPSKASQIFCRSRQWAKSQHVVSHLAHRRGYVWPLEPLQNFYFNPEIDTLCPIMEQEWTSEAFYTLCEVIKIIKVCRIAIGDCTHAEDALKSRWGSFCSMKNIENWSSSFKEIIMYTTKRSFDEHYRPNFAPWESSRITLSMYQSKARSIQMHHSRPTLKKLIAIKNAQDMADEGAKRNGEGRTMVEGIPAWLFEKTAKADLDLRMMVEVGSLDPEIGEDENGGDGNGGDENDGGHDEDEDEELEPDEGIEDENSDDYFTD